MKRIRVSVLCAAIASIALTGAAMAHHGDADRYNDDVITISGTIVELQMTNPHAIIVFDSEHGGKKARWQAELGGPQQLQRTFGWTRSTVKAGDKITITGRQAKSGAPYLNLTERANIVLATTGKEIYRTENFGAPPPPPGTGTSTIN